MPITHIRIWQQWDNIGLEYLKFIADSATIRIDSTVIGVDESNTYFRLRYQIECDAHYQVQRVDLDLAGHLPITLSTDGEGHWFDTDHQPISALDGCIDIDIS